jgi:hypothetical protein
MNFKFIFLTLLFIMLGLNSAWAGSSQVTLLRTPNDGIQPQVVTDTQGRIHLVYFKGESSAGDIYYTRWNPGQKTWSNPIRVNSQQGSAVAMGSIRGAQMAVGKMGRVHVVWNGSDKALPKLPSKPNLSEDNPLNNRTPLLYSRLNDAGDGFEDQRDLMQASVGLDGGGTIAADKFGNVYAAWHGWAATDMEADETSRRVWVTCSTDEGKTFSGEKAANTNPTGACGCCGMKAFTDKRGTLFLIYRAAEKYVNRDEYLLFSKDRGQSFNDRLLDGWKVQGCPMSSAAFTEGPGRVWTAWQSHAQVYYAPIDPESLELGDKVPAPLTGENRKYPVLASNYKSEVILAWTEGISWGKGGRLAWQVFDKNGQAVGEQGRAGDVPVWSFAAVFARPDGRFTGVY